MTRRMLLPAAMVSVLLAGGCGRSKSEPFVEAAHAAFSNATGDPAAATPIFNVHDLRASQTYYRDVLGFTVPWDYGDPPDFGAVKRGDTVIFLCQGCQGNPGAWVHVFTRDVDRLYGELVARKAIIRMPPRDMPWHLREMQVADPSGNVIRFASETRH